MWFIEERVFDPDSEERLRSALIRNQIGFQIVDSRGFQAHADAISNETVFRGSCWFILQMSASPLWNSMVWGTPDEFRVSNYLPIRRHFLLNDTIEVIALVELAWKRNEIWKRLADNQNRIFIRPDDGFKSFAGSLVELNRFEEWYEARRAFCLPGNTQIVAAKPIEIQVEYRCILVDGHVAAASRYKPDISSDVPRDVLEWAETCHKNSGSRLRIYAVDVACTPKGLRVVEIGSAACVDYYDANLDALVGAVENALSQ